MGLPFPTPENFDFRSLTAIDIFASLTFIIYLLFKFRSNEKSRVTIEAVDLTHQKLKVICFEELTLYGGGYYYFTIQTTQKTLKMENYDKRYN